MPRVARLPIRSLETQEWELPDQDNSEACEGEEIESDDALSAHAMESDDASQGSERELECLPKEHDERHRVVKDYDLAVDKAVFVGHKLSEATTSLTPLYQCLVLLRHLLKEGEFHYATLVYVGIGQALTDHCPSYKLHVSHEDNISLNAKRKAKALPKSKKAKLRLEAKQITEDEKLLIYCYRVFWALSVCSMDRKFGNILEMISKYRAFWKGVEIEGKLSFKVTAKVMSQLSHEFNDVRFVYGCLGRYAVRDLSLLPMLASGSLSKLEAWLVPFAQTVADRGYKKVPMDTLTLLSQLLVPSQLRHTIGIKPSTATLEGNLDSKESLISESSALSRIGAALLRVFLGYFKQSKMYNPDFRTALYVAMASPSLMHFYSESISTDIESHTLRLLREDMDHLGSIHRQPLKPLQPCQSYSLIFSEVYLLESLRQARSQDSSSLQKVSQYTSTVKSTLFPECQSEESDVGDKRLLQLKPASNLKVSSEEIQRWKPLFAKLFKHTKI